VPIDKPHKCSGCMHAAFIGSKLEEILNWAQREGVRIKEGPVDRGHRVACFTRDPNGNVLEFNALVDPAENLS
jgi:lactoylglutathione lyase